MTKPYRSRTRLLFITDCIRNLEIGQEILIRGAAAGSVKSIVSRWKLANPKIQMQTRKAIDGVIVKRYRNRTVQDATESI